jgi:multidrug efflux pump subunit AcrB
MKMIALLLKNRILVLLATAVLIAAGIVAWLHLPIDAFPDVTNTQVMILSKAPGLAAVDVEQRVSYPIEQVMRGLPRVKQVRSLSKAGLSQVVIIFEARSSSSASASRASSFRQTSSPSWGPSPRASARSSSTPSRARARARRICARCRTGLSRRCSSPFPG